VSSLKKAQRDIIGQAANWISTITNHKTKRRRKKTFQSDHNSKQGILKTEFILFKNKALNFTSTPSKATKKENKTLI